MKNKIKKSWRDIKKWYNKTIVNNKKKYKLKEMLVIILIVFSFGIVMGGIIMYGKGPFGFHSSLSVNEFMATYNDIANSYYKDVDKDKLLEAGINGMVNYLGDPYATYLTKEDADSFNEDIEGVYSGIGAEVKLEDKKIVIGRVFEDSPASKAGLKENDILLKVDDKQIENETISSIASLVKGKEGTEVKITIERDKEEKEFVIKRGVVDSVTVQGKIIEKNDKKIGYLSISLFSGTTYKQFEKELKALEEKKIDSLIIDVRGNSGGYLTTVTDIISLFVQKGLPIYQLKTKDDIEIFYDKTKEERSYPIAVLTNSLSASASEVLIGALKETYGATIVGTKSFGKGRVQKVYTLSNGSVVKYTYQEWLTPLGKYIDGVGITPDVEVKYEYKDKVDNQLEKALEILCK